VGPPQNRKSYKSSSISTSFAVCVNKIMQMFQEQIRILTHLGLTSCEARVYLTLANSGMNSAKAISKASKISKPDVYRVLATLKERGIIERVISAPSMFKAASPEQSLLAMFEKKHREHTILREETRQLLLGLKKHGVKEAPMEEEQQFVLIPNKVAVFEKRKRQIKTAQKSIDVLNSSKFFPKALLIFEKEAKQALQRGVRIRMINEKIQEEKPSEYFKSLKESSNFEMKSINVPPRAVITIYDEKEALFTTSATASLEEASALWTNNPSLVTVMDAYFEMLWNKPD
jgi:sugar-specific transcriptional regulator TrmB